MNELPIKHKLHNGEFIIEKILGKGGFGITYKATQIIITQGRLGGKTETKTQVAIKEYFFQNFCQRKDDGFSIVVNESQIEFFNQFKEKLIKEAHILAKFVDKHFNIVDVYDVFEENNTAYIVMQYIESKSLKEIIDEKKLLDEKTIYNFFIPIIETLIVVHKENILHLDIKPSNILIEKNTEKPYLIDFGASKMYDDVTLDAISSVPAARTDGYAPPEQYAKIVKFSPTTDIYALGATIYHALTGTKPPESNSLSTGDENLIPPRERNKNISQNLENIILKAMNITKLKRFQTATEFKTALLNAKKSFEQKIDNDITQIDNVVEIPKKKEVDLEKTEIDNSVNIFEKKEVAKEKKVDNVVEIPKKKEVAKENKIDLEKTQIDSPDEIAWAKTKTTNTKEAYENFVKNFAQSKYINEAKKQIAELTPKPIGIFKKLFNIFQTKLKEVVKEKNNENDWVKKIKCLKTLTGRTNVVTSVSFSLDGKTIASGSYDGTVKLWDVTSGQCLKTFEGHTHWVYSVSFSPDGKTIASGSRDNTVKLWDKTSGQCLKTFEGHTNWVFSVSFSPDGKSIASGSYDGTVKLWDVTSRQCLKTFEGHTSDVRSVSFSPDGKTIASGSDDGTVKLWDKTSGQCLKTLTGHTESVYSVCFSPDGKYIASGSGDNTIKIWNVSDLTKKK